MIFTLEDYLITLHTGQWFGFNNLNGDDANKTYVNLVIHSSDAKPSESDCIAGVAALQSNWDTKDYARSRATAYPTIQEQLDMQYWDGVNGTTIWADTVASVKSENPKP